MIRKELAPLVRLEKTHLLCLGVINSVPGPGPVALLTLDQTLLPVKASQRAGKSPERRLSACVDTNPGLRGEASPGMG